MDPVLYQAKDYRGFIHHKIKENQGVRGYKTRLSEAASCQKSYLSQVLNSHVQLTENHAAGLSAYWGLSPEDADYFISLVLLERATNPALKSLLQRKIKAAQKSSNQVAARLSGALKTDTHYHAEYYSSWHPAAVHVLLSIPGFTDAVQISSRLKVPVETVRANLLLLEKMKLIARTGANGGWKVIEHDVLLPSGSPWDKCSQTAWRQKAISKIQHKSASDLHYTAVYALSRSAVEEIHEVLLGAIQKAREIMIPSPEEELVCLTLDFFRVD